MMETSEAAKWLKINPHQLLNDSKGKDAKIPGFWLSERIIRFHPRTIIAKLAHDAGLPPEVIAAMFGLKQTRCVFSDLALLKPPTEQPNNHHEHPDEKRNP
jgi:hypothetical protein